MVLLYAGLGVSLMISVFIASGNSPRMIHANYDSISAAARMQEAWNGLDRPERYVRRSGAEWEDQFEKALTLEEGNITEPGEREIAKSLREHWERYKLKTAPVLTEEFTEMNRLLTNLVSVNERGMFRIAQENIRLSRMVLIGGLIYFCVTLVLALILADELATRLSRPLKSMAEALHRRSKIGKRLKQIEPDTLELLVLSNELRRLWDRVTETERVNILEVVSQNTKLETVLEAVEDGLLVINKNGKVSHCNGCLLELVGLTMDQVRDQPWRDLPTTSENYLKLRALIRENMPEVQEIELGLPSAVRHFSARSRKICGPSGATIAFLFLLQDTTEKRHREQFRSDFIDLLSHELKTPLQSMGTAAELLVGQIGNLPESARSLVETISEDVQRLRALANEFVQVTQSHSKVMKLKLESAALEEALSEWIKPFRVVAKSGDVKLSFVRDGAGPIWARIDLVKFQWVVSNLLSNAIRFSPLGGEVEVLVTSRNGTVEIQVRDQGPGISEEDQLRMFEPFFQSPMGVSSGKQGLFGIGLTIAKKVVEAHEGRIEYHARQPQGSEFIIQLPSSLAAPRLRRTYGGVGPYEDSFS